MNIFERFLKVNCPGSLKASSEGVNEQDFARL
jgi:hypothetical protein